MLLSGSSAVRGAKKKSEARSSGRRSGFTRRLGLDIGLKPGETASAVVYFCGLFEEEVDISDYLEDGKVDLDEMDMDDLMEMATEIGARVWEDIKEEHLKSSIERHLTVEKEPVLWVRHYTQRNQGRFDGSGGNRKRVSPTLNCGDPKAVVDAEDWNFETRCRPCHERQNGDKGVGNAAQRVAWSVYSLTWQHRVKAEKKGEWDDYIDCTQETKGRCRYCAQNRKIDPRKQSDIPREELEKMVSSYGYASLREVAMVVFDLPAGQEPLVTALATNIRMTLCRCGEGKLDVTGACCPECSEDFDYDDLLIAGWNPEEPDPEKQLHVVCGSCNEQVKPEPAFECDACDDPTSARLGDVPVRITCIKGERGSNWSFQVEGEACPMVLGDDDQTDKILNARMPDWEKVTEVPSVKDQLVYLGLHKDPLGEEDMDDDDDDEVAAAPTFGSKSKKGGKKGGKGSKSGVQKRRGGFTSRG